MEESAVQQENPEAARDRADDGGKADWKNECSFSSLLKHSCLLCWSSPRDSDVIEMDERVVVKAAEIRELENAVTVENLELQEQQSDRQELEDTLVKLDKHKDKLIQQIKTTRQLCYEESQKILSLQAEETKKESQVEEYERELARARWRLKKLREEVKQAKMKVEEAGERNTPLKDSIRQSYEEILQEENTLCSLSGGGVSPESQVGESTSPADTTEEDPLPMRPWGRSQSLPAYADLILGADGLSFCNNLAGTREEDDSGTSSPKDMDRSDIDEDPEDRDVHNTRDKEGEEGSTVNPNPLSQLDFYQDNPFNLCQTEHDVFNEDLFTKTDSSDGFASDPFKGSDPFAADVLFPEADMGTNEGEENVGEDADTSLSCAENRASTGTQCFESEFPDEDSDIEISYSREDLESIAVVRDSCGFKPIQSSSEELLPELIQVWQSQGQHSVESDPTGYELDVCPVSPPCNAEEHSVGSLAGTATIEATGPQQGLSCGSAQAPRQHSEDSQLEPDWTDGLNKAPPCDSSCKVTKEARDMEDEPPNSGSPKNVLDSQNCFVQCDSDQNSFEVNYESTSPPSYDPYGFKLSPEHSSHILLDPDEAELSPEPIEDVSFDPEASSSLPHELNFDPYGFDITASQVVRDSDPYGFKLSPEEENQEVLDLCGLDDLEATGFENNEQIENCNRIMQNVPKPHAYENQEVLELCPTSSIEKVLEPRIYDNQEVLETCNHGNQELLDFSHPENQEVPDLDCHENQELLDFCINEHQKGLVSCSADNKEFQELRSDENQKLLDFHIHENQEVLDLFNTENLPKGNNNQCCVEPDPNLCSTNNSSESDLASEDLQGLELNNTNINSANMTNNTSAGTLSGTISNMSTNQDLDISTTQTSHTLLEGDLGSVFGAGGYIGCPDVADDLEPLDRRQETTAPEPVQPVRPVRPPRPSLRAKAQFQDIDLK